MQIRMKWCTGWGKEDLNDHQEGQAWFALVNWPGFESPKEIMKADLYFQFASCCVLRRPQAEEQNERPEERLILGKASI